jgi:Amt family ammonium transporter
LFYGNPQQLVAQVLGLVFVLVWDGVMTFVLLKLISIVVPLRLTDKQLEIGDEAVHGDAAYELMPVPPAVTYQAPPVGSATGAPSTAY